MSKKERADLLRIYGGLSLLLRAIQEGDHASELSLRVTDEMERIRVLASKK